MLRSHKIAPLLFSVVALLLFLLLEWIGGVTWPLDVAAIRAAMAWRAGHPQLTALVIVYTRLGGVVVLLGLTGAGALWLWGRRERTRAAILLATVLGGRIGIELIKLCVDRPRPSYEAHPVVVHSQSFPSAHAGNSMLTFLSLALFVSPDRWRAPSVFGAVIASLAMGATRPLLGVHWPSDVLAGWLYGATLAVLGWHWFSWRNGENTA